MRDDLLLPEPRRVEPTGRILALDARPALEAGSAPEGTVAALERLRQACEALSLPVGGGAPRLRLSLEAGDEQEAYRLLVDPELIEIRGATPAALSHGLSTLAQWLRLHTDGRTGVVRLPGVRIDDGPDLGVRGVMLDISRSRVPTMERLEDLVETLAAWKINELQLYMEHTFAYDGHEEVWRRASPVTPEEARHLDAFCAERHIELVPNQNSFGHFHRWLRHERYRPLAECPEGIEHPFSESLEPFSLCPLDPGSLELLEDLYAQLLPNFASRQLHVGFDETLDLGRGRSRQRVERLGAGVVYAEFLGAVASLAARHGRRIQFWGDILAGEPAILDRLPRDAVVAEWGYEAGHPFEERAARLAEAGLEFRLCPGTSSWLSLGGRLGNAISNITEAATTALDHGASGILVTDWGDRGHLQPPVVSLPGLLVGAAVGWRSAAGERLSAARVATLLDLYVFADAAAGLGRSLASLGETYRLTGADAFNGSPLFHLLTRPDWPLDHPRLRGLSENGLEEAGAVIDAVGQLSDGLAAAETAWVREAEATAVELGLARLRQAAEKSVAELGSAARRRLAERLDALGSGHRRLWRASSRGGGYDESAAILRCTRDRLRLREPLQKQG